MPVGSVIPNTNRFIWPGHPDAMYADVFPTGMTVNNQDTDMRLDPQEG